MKKIALVLILALSGCATSEDRHKWVMVAGAIAGGALIYQVAKNGGAGGAAPGQVTDYQWDWDQQYNGSLELVWVCRGVQTARYAEEWRCSGLPQTDWRWPQK